MGLCLINQPRCRYENDTKSLDVKGYVIEQFARFVHVIDGILGGESGTVSVKSVHRDWCN